LLINALYEVELLFLHKTAAASWDHGVVSESLVNLISTFTQCSEGLDFLFFVDLIQGLKSINNFLLFFLL
jgi:hypothetical protein